MVSILGYAINEGLNKMQVALESFFTMTMNYQIHVAIKHDLHGSPFHTWEMIEARNFLYSSKIAL